MLVEGTREEEALLAVLGRDPATDEQLFEDAEVEAAILVIVPVA